MYSTAKSVLLDIADKRVKDAMQYLTPSTLTPDLRISLAKLALAVIFSPLNFGD